MDEKKSFSVLLSATDPELLSWLMAHSTPKEEDLRAIVDKIRQYRLQYSQDPRF
jgi:succinate dehydrogenase flavin-adding protein (antitoxin of CptAB toxin-antitoxin module)